MQHLQYLDLSENEFEEFSQDFGVLRALRIFNISKNKISSMPCKYFNLQRFCYHYQSCIWTFKADLNEMVCLRDFNISNNKIDHLPHEKVRSKLIKQQYILKTEIQIDCLSSLRKLEAAQNQISSIPTEYENLHIEHLDLSNNIIRELPGLRNVSPIWKYDIQIHRWNSSSKPFERYYWQIMILKMSPKALKRCPCWKKSICPAIKSSTGPR